MLVAISVRYPTDTSGGLQATFACAVGASPNLTRLSQEPQGLIGLRYRRNRYQWTPPQSTALRSRVK